MSFQGGVAINQMTHCNLLTYLLSGSLPFRTPFPGKAAKGDYSKYRKPPPGIERSGTPRPGAPLVGQKVVEFGV